MRRFLRCKNTMEQWVKCNMALFPSQCGGDPVSFVCKSNVRVPQIQWKATFLVPIKMGVNQEALWYTVAFVWELHWNSSYDSATQDYSCDIYLWPHTWAMISLYAGLMHRSMYTCLYVYSAYTSIRIQAAYNIVYVYHKVDILCHMVMKISMIWH